MNGLAACLEYGTSSWMCISVGHNGIWTSWAFLQIPTWPKPKTKNFLLWINANRLCLHVGLEFWTIFSFTCSESTSFTTCKFCLYTLYKLKIWRLLTNYKSAYRVIGNYCDAGLNIFLQGLMNFGILLIMNKSSIR